MKKICILVMIFSSFLPLFSQDAKKLKVEEGVASYMLNLFEDFDPAEIFQDTLKSEGNPGCSLSLVLNEEELPSLTKIIESAGFDWLDDKAGYFFVSEKKAEKNFFKGKRALVSLKHYVGGLNSKDEVVRQLVGNYKINCMPQEKDFFALISIIFETIKTNKNLQNSLFGLKICKKYPSVSNSLSNNNSLNKRICAPIVIFPATGKSHAQIVLNEFFKPLSKFEGVGKFPPFNAQVTSLLFIAQGDVDFKEDKYNEYYEVPNKIYYNAEKFSPLKPDMDHYLEHPETKNKLCFRY